MGGGWLANALLIGGTVAQKVAMDNAAKARQQVLNAEETKQTALGQKARDLVTRTAEKYGGEQRAQATDQAEQTAQASLGTSLAKAQNAEGLPQSTEGNVSDSYVAGKARATAAELDRAARLTQLMAKFRAPTDLRMREGLDDASVASEGASIAGDRQSIHRAAMLDAEQAGIPNQGLMLAGQAAQMYGGQLGASNIKKKIALSGMMGSKGSARPTSADTSNMFGTA